MVSLFSTRLFGYRSADELDRTSVEEAHSEDAGGTALLLTLGWISAGAAALAFGLFVGRELRLRYKFNRRTPYDFYAHSGDAQDLEFGVGI